MGRMNGNQIRSATASAVSQISGSVEAESGSHSSHERVKRRGRGRRMNLTVDDSRKASPTSGEHFCRNISLQTSDLSNSYRNTSSSHSESEFHGSLPQGAYAGAKFGDSPSPRLLPPPPLHWISGGVLHTPVFGSCVSLTSELKTLLQVA